MPRRDYRKVTQRKPKTKGKGDELIDWTIQDLRNRWGDLSEQTTKYKEQLLHGMDRIPAEVSQPKRKGIQDIPSIEERRKQEEIEVQQALGQDAQGKTIEPSSFDPFRTELDSMFKQLIENPDFTDQQKFPTLKAMFALQNSVFDEEYQEPTYSHAIAFGQEIEDKKNAEFIDEKDKSKVNDGGKSEIQVADNQTDIKATGGGEGVSGVQSKPQLTRDEITSNDPQPVEKEKGPDLTIGSSPWSRGSGTSYRDANAATEELLTKEGWDLRGLGIAQKQDLFSDYRTGRLPKTDTSIFFNNQRIKKR